LAGLAGAPAPPQHKTSNAQHCRRHNALIRNAAASCFPSTPVRRENALGAPSTLVLNQYRYDTVEKEFAGVHCQRKPLGDRVIKMQIGLKSMVYVDDMREWSRW
jgi:hypothetical protein